jgi:hypothetical protein
VDLASIYPIITDNLFTSTATTISELFLLRIPAAGSKLSTGHNTQESSFFYLEANSSITPRCERAALFQLVSGRLLKGGILVTSSDPPSTQLLLGTGVSRDISLSFSLTAGLLSWRNPRFPRQAAFFCLMSEMVYVYFDAAPEGCVDVPLSILSRKSRLGCHFSHRLLTS